MHRENLLKQQQLQQQQQIQQQQQQQQQAQLQAQQQAQLQAQAHAHAQAHAQAQVQAHIAAQQAQQARLQRQLQTEASTSSSPGIISTAGLRSPTTPLPPFLRSASTQSQQQKGKQILQPPQPQSIDYYQMQKVQQQAHPTQQQQSSQQPSSSSINRFSQNGINQQQPQPPQIIQRPSSQSGRLSIPPPGLQQGQSYLGGFNNRSSMDEGMFNRSLYSQTLAEDNLLSNSLNGVNLNQNRPTPPPIGFGAIGRSVNGPLPGPISRPSGRSTPESVNSMNNDGNVIGKLMGSSALGGDDEPIERPTRRQSSTSSMVPVGMNNSSNQWPVTTPLSSAFSIPSNNNDKSWSTQQQQPQRTTSNTIWGESNLNNGGWPNLFSGNFLPPTNLSNLAATNNTNGNGS